MIIAIDIGNSSITIGCIDACRTYFVEHISTSQSKTDLEYAITIKNILELYNIPVSYTHLDVYKRQRPYSGSIPNASAAACISWSAIGCGNSR